MEYATQSWVRKYLIAVLTPLIAIIAGYEALTLSTAQLYDRVESLEELHSIGEEPVVDPFPSLSVWRESVSEEALGGMGLPSFVIFYKWHIDHLNTGTIDVPRFEKYIKEKLPDAEAEVWVCIDIEGKYTNGLKATPHSPQWSHTVDQFGIAITTLKQLRPNARVSFWGPPFTPRWLNGVTWEAATEEQIQAEYAQWEASSVIWDRVDWWSPGVYDAYAGDKHTKAQVAWVTAETKLATHLKDVPVIPSISPRYHNKEQIVDLSLIPEAEIWRDQIEPCIAAGYPRFIWWGADKYFYRTNNLPVSEYPHGEDPDVVVATYFNGLHLEQAKMFQRLIDEGYSEPPPPTEEMIIDLEGVSMGVVYPSKMNGKPKAVTVMNGTIERVLARNGENITLINVTVIPDWDSPHYNAIDMEGGGTLSMRNSIMHCGKGNGIWAKDTTFDLPLGSGNKFYDPVWQGEIHEGETWGCWESMFRWYGCDGEFFFEEAIQLTGKAKFARFCKCSNLAFGGGYMKGGGILVGDELGGDFCAMEGDASCGAITIGPLKQDLWYPERINGPSIVTHDVESLTLVDYVAQYTGEDPSGPVKPQKKGSFGELTIVGECVWIKKDGTHIPMSQYFD